MIRQQPFASPEEALQHHGVKGMKWGVRKAAETGDQNSTKKNESSAKTSIQRNEIEKRKLADTKLAKSSASSVTKKSESDGQFSGLSSTQKKALLAAGIGVVAVGGVLAYKHYAGGSALPDVGKLTDWGNPIPKKPDLSGLKTRRLSDKPLGALGKEGEFALPRTNELTLDISKGYADWRPVGGFSNELAAARHASVIRSLEDMRKRYPTIRNMNIEVVPMSQAYPKGTKLMNAGMVRQLGEGEARIFYNDVTSAVTADMSSFVPGFRDPDHLGTHEMGHVLAGANGALFSKIAGRRVVSKAPSFQGRDDINFAESFYHKQLFRKHGLSFEELSKLGGYASTEPREALAELSANYHSPNLRAKMDPDLARRAEALFNDMGGVT